MNAFKRVPDRDKEKADGQRGREKERKTRGKRDCNNLSDVKSGSNKTKLDLLEGSAEPLQEWNLIRR